MCWTHLFRKDVYCNSSFSENECINWIHHFKCARECGLTWLVFILNTILTFYKQTKCKVGDLSRGWLEGSLFDSLWCWVPNKAVLVWLNLGLNPGLPDHWRTLMSRVFANGPGYLGSISSRVIPKTQKIVLDAALHNTHHFEVRIKGKVEQHMEWSSALPYTSV